MDLTSLFSKMRKQVSFHRLDSDAARSEDVPIPHYEEDQELDGFLVVGDEMSHCTISPIANGLPSYTDSHHAEILSQSESRLSSQHWLSESSLRFPAPSCTPVSDVPMDFHSSIKTKANVDNIFKSVDLEQHPFNWAKYSYDFTNEEIYLRDVECKNENAPI